MINIIEYDEKKYFHNDRMLVRVANSVSVSNTTTDLIREPTLYIENGKCFVDCEANVNIQIEIVFRTAYPGIGYSIKTKVIEKKEQKNFPPITIQEKKYIIDSENDYKKGFCSVFQNSNKAITVVNSNLYSKEEEAQKHQIIVNAWDVEGYSSIKIQSKSLQTSILQTKQEEEKTTYNGVIKEGEKRNITNNFVYNIKENLDKNESITFSLRVRNSK